MAYSVMQFVPHSEEGGMHRVATILDQELPRHGLPSRLISLDTIPDGPGKIVHAAAYWVRLVRTLKRARPYALIAHAPKTAALVLSAARVAGVKRRLMIVHGRVESIGPRGVKVLIALERLGIITHLVHVGRSVSDSFAQATNGRLRGKVVRNGIPLSYLGAPKPWATDAPLRLLCAARLVPEKNLDILVLAASRLADVDLTICGDGPEREHLLALAEKLGVRLRLPGHIEQHSLFELYRDSDAFLFPSYIEGLPLVLIEAASSGLPVVAADTAANREVMGDAAIYCPSDDVEAWAQGIQQIRDHETRTLLRERGLARSKMFDLSDMVTEYIRLLGI